MLTKRVASSLTRQIPAITKKVSGCGFQCTWRILQQTLPFDKILSAYYAFASTTPVTSSLVGSSINFNQGVILLASINLVGLNQIILANNIIVGSGLKLDLRLESVDNNNYLLTQPLLLHHHQRKEWRFVAGRCSLSESLSPTNHSNHHHHHIFTELNSIHYRLHWSMQNVNKNHSIKDM